jgi:hypothetical protein
VVGLEFDVGERRAGDRVHRRLDGGEPAGLYLGEQQAGLDATDGLDAEVDDRRAVVQFPDVDREFVGEVDGLVDQLDGHHVGALHTSRSDGRD